MKIATLSFAAALALLAGGCTTQNYRHAPYYGPSQLYAYPSGYGYYPSRSYYAPAGYGYRTPYGAPYGGAGPGPSITFTLPQG